MGQPLRFDLIVLGGGLTGLALAAAVAGAGRSVAVVERAPLPARPTAAPYDGRVTAVARGSGRMLAAIGAWRHLAPAAQPILDIVVREGASSLAAVRYDHREVGGEPLGHIVENRAIRDGLLARARELGDRLTLLAPAEVAGVEAGPVAAEVALADGRTLRAPLVAVCEGKGSATRERLGVGVRRRPYRQTGIVCTLRHERPHGGVAVERFFPDGPFARLPMLPGDRSSIVWALDDALAAEVTRLGDADFLAEVAERFGEDLGGLALEGPRWHYPLELALADAYAAPRAVLVGDAARGIHPIAGQGWNLALRDVATVAEIAVDRLRLGLDPGDAVALERYAAWRRFDGAALAAVTDGLNRLFANDLFPVAALRRAGLAAVDRLPPLKRAFMRHAMGVVGELPRAMRGEAI